MKSSLCLFLECSPPNFFHSNFQLPFDSQQQAFADQLHRFIFPGNFIQNVDFCPLAAIFQNVFKFVPPVALCESISFICALWFESAVSSRLMYEILSLQLQCYFGEAVNLWWGPGWQKRVTGDRLLKVIAWSLVPALVLCDVRNLSYILLLL